MAHHSKHQTNTKSIQLPKDLGVDQIVSFIAQHIQNEQAIEEATAALKRSAEYQYINIASHENQHVLINLMKNYDKDLNILSNVFSVIELSLQQFVNEFQKKNKKDHRLHIDLSPKFLERFFYLFLVIFFSSQNLRF